MGTFSIEQKENLIWLGRYTERVYTILKNYFTCYDKMIDIDENYYTKFCASLDIPNVYESKEDFMKRYPYDECIPDSIISNLIKSYNNAVVLREEIGSETLSYIQLAIYALNMAKEGDSPLVDLQKVMDMILAFWAVEDDDIENPHVRDLVKLGKRIERIDLYSRLEMPYAGMHREIIRLIHRADSLNMPYDKEKLENIKAIIESDTINYYEVVRELEEFKI